MSEIKLKPCPFCGSANVKIYNLSGLHEVACVDCCSCSSLFHTKAEAAEAWNRRTTEAPKQEKSEPYDDLINREDAIKLIYDCKDEHCADRVGHPINYGTLVGLILDIRNLPNVEISTEARPRKGEWLLTDNPDYDVCSNCYSCYYKKIWFPAKGRNFCPNCGADMRKSGADMRKSVAKQQQNGGMDKK